MGAEGAATGAAGGVAGAGAGAGFGACPPISEILESETARTLRTVILEKGFIMILMAMARFPALLTSFPLVSGWLRLLRVPAESCPAGKFFAAGRASFTVFRCWKR
jgi:hypothetical protein